MRANYLARNEQQKLTLRDEPGNKSFIFPIINKIRNSQQQEQTLKNITD